MLQHPNVAIYPNRLYRKPQGKSNVIVRTVLLDLPKVKVEFPSGRQSWIDCRCLSEY